MQLKDQTSAQVSGSHDQAAAFTDTMSSTALQPIPQSRITQILSAPYHSVLLSASMPTPQQALHTAFPTHADTSAAHAPAASALPPAHVKDDILMDDTPVSIPAREVPDDIFISICAVLRAKMGNPIEPTDSDRLILRTLLNIQVVSKAGWRAATPIIWKNIILTSDKR